MLPLLVLYQFSIYNNPMGTQTVDIPANRRLTLEVPPEVPVGRAILTFTPFTGDRALEEAGKTWAWNRAHSEEVRTKLQKLRGSLSVNAFGGLDGVAYQRKVRNEWDVD
jgi:hypothetical protein